MPLPAPVIRATRRDGEDCSFIRGPGIVGMWTGPRVVYYEVLPTAGGLPARPDRDRHPRYLRLLPRQRGRPGRRRRDRRRRPGGAVHPQEARRRLPRAALDFCLRTPASPPTDRLRRLLRQAPDQVRAPAGDVPRLCPARFRQLPPGHARCGCGTSSTRRALAAGLAAPIRGNYVFLEHHESHAASAFFPSPFPEAAILTLDGVGEWTPGPTGSAVTTGSLTEHISFPHSLGLCAKQYAATWSLPGGWPRSSREAKGCGADRAAVTERRCLPAGGARCGGSIDEQASERPRWS